MGVTWLVEGMGTPLSGAVLWGSGSSGSVLVLTLAVEAAELMVTVADAVKE